MEKATKLKIAAGVCTLALGGSIYLSYRNGKMDESAAQFFIQLDKQLNPTGEAIATDIAFDVHYWENAGKKVGKPIYLIKQAGAADFADTIHKSWSWINDDEDQVYGVYRALKDKVQASQVAYQYYNKFKINLIDDLRARMSTSEVEEVMKIVNRLPDYRVATPAPAAPAKK